MRSPAGAILVFCIWTAPAQTDLPPEVVRLAHIKQHMKQRLQQVPNYTCLETIVRCQRLQHTAKFKTLDTVRMEVAEVKGKELFARPGQPFDESNPGAFVRGGTMASGFFAMFANALFVNDRGTMSWAGEEEIDGRKLLRYDFQVPLLRSGFHIQTASRAAIVGYHGSFWSDPRTLDALRLRILADDIPPALGLLDAGVEIEYQSVRIGEGEALLPRQADLLLTEFSGAERRNLSTFSNCRQYGSDSVLTFGRPDTPPPAVAPPK
jgi:hypothetical protein